MTVTTAGSGLQKAFVAVLAAVVALTAMLALAARADAARPSHHPPHGPAGAKFYNPPKHFPKKHGSLIWQRKAKGITPIANAKSNTLVLYSSKTINGKATAVSGIVSVPKGKAPKHGWPVITYAHGTTGTADACAPTRSPASSLQAPYTTYIDPQLQAWTKAGYAVVRTDYEGLGTPGTHGYLVGVDEGRAVLDIVAAAQDLNPDIGKRFLIAGHSQGGHAALFAAGLARKWGKGLKLRGTVAYAPASHLADQAELLPALTAPSPLSALVTLIVQGASTVTPEVQVQQILSDQVLALYPQVKRTCLPQLGASDSLGGVPPSEVERDGVDDSALLRVLGEQNPAVRTKAPILLAQGTADTTVFPFLTDQLNDELTALGDEVDYQKFPGVTHGETPAAAEDDALAFFEKRLPPRR